MKSIKIVVLLITACSLTGLYIYSNTHFTPTDENQTSVQLQGIPENVMPEGALSTCLEKEVGASCSFKINQQGHAGVCQDIMGTLTCGPDFPEDEKGPQ